MSHRRAYEGGKTPLQVPAIDLDDCFQCALSGSANAQSLAKRVMERLPEDEVKRRWAKFLGNRYAAH